MRARLPRVDIPVDVVFEPRDAFRATMLAPPASAPPAAETPRTRSTLVPVALCAFVAFTFATLAFLKSPYAKHPQVAPYADAIVARIG